MKMIDISNWKTSEDDFWYLEINFNAESEVRKVWKRVNLFHRILNQRKKEIESDKDRK